MSGTAGGGGAERGSVTLWILGLCLMLFLLGGISVDLWRAFSTRRALASAADAAALSGASAIDEARYRSTGAIVLVPPVAAERAHDSLRRQLDTSAARGADVRADARTVTVSVRGVVRFSLLRVVGAGSFDVEVDAVASPRRTG